MDGGFGWETSSSREDSTVLDGGTVVFPLFQQVLFFLLFLISAERFPLEALGLLPPLQRRMVFLRLPVVDLHRVERCSPSATKGINMSKVWKEIFSKRLCPQTKWLTRPMALKLSIFGGGNCSLKNKQTPNILDHIGVRRVLFAVPFKQGPAMRREGRFETIKRNICANCWYCKRSCTMYKFYCSPKYLHLFHADYCHSASQNEFDPSFLEAVVALNLFEIEIDSLSIAGIPSINIAEAPFLSNINTLDIELCPFIGDDTFLYALLEVLVSSSSLLTLQNLSLSMCSHCSHSKCGVVVQTIAPFFSAVSSNQDVIPFLNLKNLKIAANFSKLKSDVMKLIAIINSQEQLERLEISSTVRHSRVCFSTHEKIFQVMLSCFLKPTFQCLTLNNLYIHAAALLKVEENFLISTACRNQQLILQKLRVGSYSTRKDFTYASDSAVCTKSLSVISCSMEDVGLFSAADIASPTLLYPGSQEVKLLHCLDRVDFYKLPAALEKGIGILKLLDVSGSNLSSIIVRASLLLEAIFRRPYLSELELVLMNCHLRPQDLDQLYYEWEKARSHARRYRARKRLKRLCVCHNHLPVNKSNLEAMANTLC